MKPNAVNGFDVSHHNGVFDFEKMAALGHKFCFIKASEGTHFVDPQFKANWDKAPRAGLLAGAYHFLRPGVDAATQAAHFLDVVGPTRVGDLPCVLDFEVTDGVRVGPLKQAALTWLEIVEKATGKKPIFYSYRSFLADLGDLSAFAAYPLWLAVYTTKVVSPMPPPAWPRWTFWQYSEAGGLDLNVLNGSMTLAGLKAMAGVN